MRRRFHIWRAVALALLTATSAQAAAPKGSGEPDRVSGSMLGELREIYFRNACAEPLEAAIHFQAPDGTWRMSRWLPLAVEEIARVAATRGAVYFSTARRPDGGVMPIRGRKARATVRGDAAPVLFGVRPLAALEQGDVLQVFFCEK